MHVFDVCNVFAGDNFFAVGFAVGIARVLSSINETDDPAYFFVRNR